MLHYFGEIFDEIDGPGADMDDNATNPKPKVEAKDSVLRLLDIVVQTAEKFKSKELVKVLMGKPNALIVAHKIHLKPFFGAGSDQSKEYWMALLRQTIVSGLLHKEIEQYGVVHLTDLGREFIKSPKSFMMTVDHSYLENDSELVERLNQGTAAADEQLFSMLQDLRKKEAKKHGVPTYVIFQDSSLEDMALKYPMTLKELSQVYGVGEGKAKKFGGPFITMIAEYVKENDITRPDDLIVKSTGAKSALKLFIIQGVDRKLSLDDIARSKGITMDELLKEMEQIVFSGTRLNIDYWLEDLLDEDQQSELHDYFIEAQTDDISLASNHFNGDYEDEELRLYRIKFISEVAN